MVHRDVIRVVTPGTITCQQALEAGANNVPGRDVPAAAAMASWPCDASTGDF